jgi:hypothetical protein
LTLSGRDTVRDRESETIALEHTKNNTYLGLKINTTGNFHKAVNDLKDKSRRVFYAMKWNIKLDIPNTSISYQTHCPLWL